MIRVIKITKPDCIGCMGASFGDCPSCKVRTQEVTLCKDCEMKDENVMHREKYLCTRLHAWVEPYDFCSWSKKEETE